VRPRSARRRLFSRAAPHVRSRLAKITRSCRCLGNELCLATLVQDLGRIMSRLRPAPKGKPPKESWQKVKLKKGGEGLHRRRSGFGKGCFMKRLKPIIKVAIAATLAIAILMSALCLRVVTLLGELRVNERRHIKEVQRSRSYAELLKSQMLVGTHDPDEMESNEIELNAAIQSVRFHQRHAAFCSERRKRLSKSIFGIGW
jgi:hypothetical protein